MALALAPHKIRVNAIGPGSIMTEVLNSVVGDKLAMNRSAHPSGLVHLMLLTAAFSHVLLQ